MPVRDILTLLPPDARITGCVGDGNSYTRFEAPVKEARQTASEAHARLVQSAVDMREKYKDAEPDDKAGRYLASVRDPPTWFYSRDSSTTVAVCPGVQLHLNAHNEERPGHPDIRTNPWVVEAVIIEGFDLYNYSSGFHEDVLKRACAELRTRLAALEALLPQE